MQQAIAQITTDVVPWPNQTSWNILFGLSNKFNFPVFFSIDRDDYQVVLDVVVNDADHASLLWEHCKELNFAASLVGCLRVAIYDSFDRHGNLPQYDWSVTSVQISQEYRQWLDKIERQDVESLVE